jgi:hypothetical protein
VINRVGGPALLGAAVVVSAWLAWSRSPVSGQPETLPAPKSAEKVKFLGVASCSSMACHHFNGPKGSPRSEYSTWAGYDQHTRAYAVLEDERSQRIVRNLCGDNAQPATKQELCLRCHATREVGVGEGERFYIGDGVGCESCHGPASRYINTHYLAGFKELSPEEKEARGLRNLKDLSARTTLCASCHVGDATREVNHDLIAAGHPRLNFEMGGYHGIYAQHWPHAEDVARYPDFEARLWLIGQLTTAKNSVDLLAARASEKPGPADFPCTGDKPTRRPWPEFAEYACYACHKDLRNDVGGTPRQKARFGGLHPGAFPYGTWYLTMTREVAGLVSKDPGRLTARLDSLRTLMEQPGPNAASVAKEAAKASDILGHLLKQAAAGRPLDAAQMRSYLNSFVSNGEKLADKMIWDQAAQQYLALAALHQALFDRGDPLATSGKLKPGMQAIKKRLRGAFPKNYDSPVDFNPLANPKKNIPSLSEQFKILREALGN